jgi:MFS family permease
MIGYGRFQYRILLTLGLALMADAMETMILSFLPYFMIDLKNSNNENQHDDIKNTNTSSFTLSSSWITSIVFIGSFVGSFVLVPYADQMGRRCIFLFSTGGILSLFSILTSFCTNTTTLLFCRFMVGIGIGCTSTIIHDIWIEFVPSKIHRGYYMIWLGYFWNVGIVSVPIVAHVLVSIHRAPNTSSTLHEDHTTSSKIGMSDWRIFLLLCSLPCIISTLLGYFYLPESPRWLLSKHWYNKLDNIICHETTTNESHIATLISASSLSTSSVSSRTCDYSNHHENAIQILRHAEAINHRWRYTGNITTSLFPSHVMIVLENNQQMEATNQPRNHSSVRELICQRSTLTVFLIWALYPLLYYGTILITTTIVFTKKELTHSSNNSPSSSSSLEIFDLNSIIITSFAEVLGTAILMFVIDSIGRIRSQIVSYTIGGISMLLLCYWYDHHHHPTSSNDNNSVLVLLLCAFLARVSYKIGICATWIMTSEILPTPLRSTGHGIANSIARLSGAVCPFLVMSQVKSSSSSSNHETLTSIGILLCIISISIAVLVNQLPETKGQSIG